jgi:hypothetical protein
MTYSDKDEKNPSSLMFTLTNSLKFQNLNGWIPDRISFQPQKLMRKEGLPLAYEKIGIILGLKI